MSFSGMGSTRAQDQSSNRQELPYIVRLRKQQEFRLFLTLQQHDPAIAEADPADSLKRGPSETATVLLKPKAASHKTTHYHKIGPPKSNPTSYRCTRKGANHKPRLLPADAGSGVRFGWRWDALVARLGVGTMRAGLSNLWALTHIA